MTPSKNNTTVAKIIERFLCVFDVCLKAKLAEFLITMCFGLYLSPKKNLFEILSVIN